MQQLRLRPLAVLVTTRSLQWCDPIVRDAGCHVLQSSRHLLQVSAPEEEGMQPGSADGASQLSTASAGAWRSSLHVQVCLISRICTHA